MMKYLQAEKATAKARERISDQLQNKATSVIFIFTREYHGDELINKH